MPVGMNLRRAMWIESVFPDDSFLQGEKKGFLVTWKLPYAIFSSVCELIPKCPGNESSQFSTLYKSCCSYQKGRGNVVFNLIVKRTNWSIDLYLQVYVSQYRKWRRYGKRTVIMEIELLKINYNLLYQEIPATLVSEISGDDSYRCIKTIIQLSF